MNPRLPSRDGFRGAVELLDQAAHELRSAPGGALLSYYLGTAPFALLCLHFWVQMSAGDGETWRLGPSALVLALGFVWMKVWQARFVAALLTGRGLAPPERSFAARFARLTQVALVFSLGLFIQAFSIILVFPSGYSAAFFQHALSNVNGSYSTREVFRRTARQSTYFPFENHSLWLLVLVFWAFLALNILGLVVLLPGLVFVFTGQHVLELSAPQQVLNSTVGCVVFLASFLCVDPLVKAAFALRSLRWQSEGDGQDLRFLVNSLSRAKGSKTRGQAAALAGAGLMGVPPDVQELDLSLDKALSQAEFGWRTRKAGQEPLARPGWLQQIFDSLSDALHAAARFVWKFLKAISGGDTEGTSPSTRSDSSLRWNTQDTLTALTLVLLVVLLALLVVRLIKRARKAEVAPGDPVAAKVPDVANEFTNPDELEASGWRELAEELWRAGKPRLAVRALYLAGVSGLSRAGLVAASGTKSVLDYKRELDRRQQTHAELGPIFEQIAAEFERVWYGDHAATHDSVLSLSEHTARLMQHVER